MKQLEASKTNSPSAVNNSPTLTAVNALVSQNIAFIVRAYSSASANMTKVTLEITAKCGISQCQGHTLHKLYYYTAQVASINH